MSAFYKLLDDQKHELETESSKNKKLNRAKSEMGMSKMSKSATLKPNKIIKKKGSLIRGVSLTTTNQYRPGVSRTNTSGAPESPGSRIKHKPNKVVRIKLGMLLLCFYLFP